MQKKKKVLESKAKTAKKVAEKVNKSSLSASNKKKAPSVKNSSLKSKAVTKATKGVNPASERKMKAKSNEALKVLSKETKKKEPKKKVAKDILSLSAKSALGLSSEAMDLYKKWLRYHKQLSDQKAKDYKMSSDYEVKAPLKHKVLGWGVVIQKRDNYIDVLFEAGLKTLIINYKT